MHCEMEESLQGESVIVRKRSKRFDIVCLLVSVIAAFIAKQTLVSGIIWYGIFCGFFCSVLFSSVLFSKKSCLKTHCNHRLSFL